MARDTRRRRLLAEPGPPQAVRFLLRLPPQLHKALALRAQSRDLSLNEYCVRRLSEPESTAGRTGLTTLLLDRANAVADVNLLGCIVYGSWSRGDAGATSDIDVLIVVDRTVPLTRSLYRSWDDGVGVAWVGRPIDVHFVHPPADPARAGGLWCEAAVEGRLLFDRDGRVEDALVAVRRAIAEGRLVRKHAHGQPYWTAA